MSASQKKSNFMNQFRDSQTKELKNLTSAQFIEVWSHYDKDGKKTISVLNQYFHFFNSISFSATLSLSLSLRLRESWN